MVDSFITLKNSTVTGSEREIFPEHDPGKQGYAQRGPTPPERV